MGKRVAIIGQGYVGLALAIRAVEVGHDVVAFDIDDARLALLSDGQSYVEDVASEQVRDALASGRFHPTADPAQLAGFDVAVVTVQTPLLHGIPDLSFVEAAGRLVGAALRPNACVILESTTYPGTTEELLAPLLEHESGLTVGADFALGYSPERIDPGNETWTLTSTPKVVSGVDAESLQRVQSFYDTLVDKTVPVRGTREAELTKLLENTFRHVNIALVNELALFANALGIDVWEAIDAASTKPFGYLRFTPGPGVGGHCLPVDPTFLSWKAQHGTGDQFRFIELANDINAYMPSYVVKRIAAALEARGIAIAHAHVLLVGLAFKPNTADAREAPALKIAGLLAAAEVEVSAVDPHIVSSLVDLESLGVRLVDLDPSVVESADLVVIVTDHSSFDYEMIQAHAAAVLDTRHRLPPGERIEHL